MKKAIVLAAGEGTRMKSKRSKVLFPLLGKPMISYVTGALELSGVEETILVGGKNTDELRRMYPDATVVTQKIGEGLPYGTGYAASLAKDFLDPDDLVLVLAGDVPLLQKDTIARFLESAKADMTILAAHKKDPTGYGRVIRDGNVRIVEEKDATDAEKKETLVNSGIYVFRGAALLHGLDKLENDNAQNEYYLTDLAEILVRDGYTTDVTVLEDDREMDGVNSRLELVRAEKELRRRVNRAYMLAGVTIEDEDSVTIEPGVVIARDVTIERDVKIMGATVIGEDTTIESGSRLTNMKIGKGVRVRQSILEDSVVEDRVDIGPFAHLRPGAVLKEGAHVGNFVEVKNATMGAGTKAGHLAYIGDADLGDGINVGCGVIFVNYDGKKKHRSVVEDGAFIGSNANVVAPVHIGGCAYIAAGSTVTEDVEEGKLVIARARQIAKERHEKKGENK